jgi:hypothetical protein
MRVAVAPAVLAVIAGVLAVPAASATPSACSAQGPAGIATTCTGVGPGTFVSVDGGGGCTLGFVLRAANRKTYVVTAGHCAVELGSGSHVWQPGRGPVVRLSAASTQLSGATPGSAIGRVVYAVQEKDDIDEQDFAVIQLERGVTPYTSVPYYGGPTGVNTALTPDPEQLNLFGRPPVLGDTVPARPLLAHSLSNREHVFATGPSAPGDSGAPVLDQEGRAVGVLLGVGGNQLTVGTLGPPEDSHGGGLVRILRLAPALAKASKALNVRLGLALGS